MKISGERGIGAVILEQLIAKAEQDHILDKDEIYALLKAEVSQEALLRAADRVRKRFVGDAVHLRGLIEFSNICSRNCKYCGLRRDNLRVERYRLSPDEILNFARKAKSYGYRTVVLQSGEDAHFTVERLTKLLRAIKALGLTITLSIGEKSTAEYKAYKEAGADRYLLRIETTDRRLYESMHPDMSLGNRIRCLKDLKSLGYEVGTGCLIGLPGQTLESLAEDILFFKALDADMIGIGPFIPNGDTPLGLAVNGDFSLSLRLLSIVRLLMPDINLPATTAMETLHPNARVVALQAGANVVMPNVTEGDYRRKYALYPGKITVKDTPEDCKLSISEKILGMDRKISEGYGYRTKRRN